MSQEQVTALRPLSLDFAWEDDDGEDHSLLDRLAASPLEATEPSCQEPTSTEHAQLEVLFTWLSPRAQQALRLRYGLAEDGRALPPEDIAHEQTSGHRASWSHTSSTSPTSKRRDYCSDSPSPQAASSKGRAAPQGRRSQRGFTQASQTPSSQARMSYHSTSTKDAATPQAGLPSLVPQSSAPSLCRLAARGPNDHCPDLGTACWSAMDYRTEVLTSRARDGALSSRFLPTPLGSGLLTGKYSPK